MRAISLKRMFTLIWGKKKVFSLIILIFSLLGILNSVRTFKSTVDESKEAVAEYEKKLDEYKVNLELQDEAIANLKENLITMQEEYENQKKYCSYSILMKLDANEIWCAEIHYAYDSEGSVGFTMNAVAAYYDSVEMRKRIEESLGYDEAYLKEILFYSFMGNVARYYMYMPDEESASLLLERVKKELANAQDQIEVAQGKYEATIESEEIGTIVDLSVQNSQKAALNTLNNLKTSVTDTKSLIESKQIARDNYAKDNAPNIAYSMGVFKKIFHFVKGGVCGLIIGLIVSILLSVIGILFERRIFDDECLRERGIHILHISGNNETNIDAVGEDIFLCASKNSIKKMIVLMVSADEALCEAGLRGFLSEKKMEIEFVKYIADRKETLTKIGECEGALIYLKNGLSLHKDLDDVCDRLDRYGVRLLGALYDEENASRKR